MSSWEQSKIDSDDESEFKKFKEDMANIKQLKSNVISITNVWNSVDFRERSNSSPFVLPINW